MFGAADDCLFGVDHVHFFTVEQCLGDVACQPSHDAVARVVNLHPISLTPAPFGCASSISGSDRQLPPAASTFSRAAAEKLNAPTVSGLEMAPAPSSFPGTTTVAFASACRSSREILMLGHVCAGLSSRPATAFHTGASFSRAACFRLPTSDCRCALLLRSIRFGAIRGRPGRTPRI
uniref:Uncharacterized protein n=1 Tax=uncultured marine group II/III euryarchaeote KM3_89_F04 TaxID=1456539 RepID=A0A075I0H6_9EURY|nr:hypothetical protein [uncultured marine group II/III euryarchaeote KM3_89_F04]